MTTTFTNIAPTQLPAAPVVVPVSPETATGWLERNTNNRTIRDRHVAALARELAEGRWHYNGDAIRFAWDGTLLDGQHRLHAIVKSGVTVPMLVVNGLPPESQQTMDQQASRTAADALRFEGQPYWNEQAAVARIALQVEGNFTKGARRTTNTEVVGFIEAHSEVLPSVQFVKSLQQSRGWRDLGVAMCAYTHMTFARIDKADADDFWLAVADMVPAYRGDPAIALGRRLADLRRNKSRVADPAMLSLIVRAWNRRRAVEPMAKAQMVDTKSFDAVPAAR